MLKMLELRRISTILLMVFIVSVKGFTTHNRAGEITYRQISDLTFEFTITTFTFTLSAADRNELTVEWGDNTTSIAPRVEEVLLPNFYKRNKYIKEHTFPGPGVYEIIVQDPNRNFGVLNIPNSVNVIFCMKTTMMINPSVGYNNTPVLLNPPIDNAAVGKVFIHNPAAYDPDGDSISYSITINLQENGEPIVGYTFPPASDTLYVDPISGDYVWDAPVDSGKFNIAMNIEEWRNGIKIGNIVRDIQVEVFNTTNIPPENQELTDYCVVAGTVVEFDFISIDIDGDSIIQTANGGPFILENSPADKLLYISSETGLSVSRFRWQTTCDHVRERAYQVVFKAEDTDRQLSLVDIDNMDIRIIGPAPVGLSAYPSSNSISLFWNKSVCTNITGYRVYRKNGVSGFIPDSCEIGIPPDIGYEAVGETGSVEDTMFLDNNNGIGLMKGAEYCYIVVALFPDGTESIASEEYCSVLIYGTPLITNVSITETDESNGSIYIAWAKPKDLDTIPANGPYEYKIYRSPGIWGENYSLIATINTVDLDDTTFVDEPVNTAEKKYSYKIELYNDEGGNTFFIGSAEASSLGIHVEPADDKLILHFIKNVPWINLEYVVYRQDPAGMSFDSIGVTADSVFVDYGLENGTTYCYVVKSIGTYNRPGIMDPLINYSYESCGIPVDNEPPCPPDLTVSSNCDSLYNRLIWNLPVLLCPDDVAYYKIFYKPMLETDLEYIYTVESPGDTVYRHYPDFSMSGCYAVSAVDSTGNESELSSPVICVDTCNYYEIPNVFTPNNDGYNDILRARTTNVVVRIGMKIYSRTGTLVYETVDPYINWDGMYNGKYVAPGIYYYHCDVYENRITGVEIRHYSGFIHVITEKGARLPGEGGKK